MKKKNFKNVALFFLAFAFVCTNAQAKMTSQANKLYNSAIIQEQAGNYTQALEAIQKALTLSPNDPILNIKLAGIYTNLGQTDKAIESYQNSIKLRPQDGFLYISLGNLYAQKYDYQAHSMLIKMRSR